MKLFITLLFLLLSGLYPQSIYSQTGTFNDRSSTKGIYQISLNYNSSQLTICEKVDGIDNTWTEEVKMMSKSEDRCEVYSESGKYVLYYYWQNGRYDYRKLSEVWVYPHIGDNLHYRTKN